MNDNASGCQSVILEAYTWSVQNELAEEGKSSKYEVWPAFRSQDTFKNIRYTVSFGCQVRENCNVLFNSEAK
jgi:hypothetical protein